MTDRPVEAGSGEVTPEEQADLPPEAPDLLTDLPEGEPVEAPSPEGAPVSEGA